jgi:diaminopimelate decarboxylase
VGKRDDEIAAALDAGILAFNVESAFELERIERVARERGRAAPISIRVNPDVDAGAHPYIATGLRSAKFGVDFEAARRMYAHAAASDALDVVGIDAHIGSQILETAPYADALDRILEMVDVLAADGITLRHLDIGGGLGIPYRDEEPAPPRAFGDVVAARLAGRDMTLVLEPGRVIAGNAGVLLMRVLGVKHNGTRTFVVVDAAMNDNIRPALYQAWQRIEPVVLREGPEHEVDVVGPICETGDFLALERPLPPVQQGDLLAMMSAGAYGFSMSSNYNSRPRAAEVLVRDGEATVVRPREQVSELFAGERLLP